MDLRGFDLNLLKVLHALLAEGSTTAAARRVGLSQPAVSAALARLRLSIGDPLFVRQGQRLTPTDYARGLADPLAEILADLEGLLTAGQPFDPANETAGFILSGSDYFAELLMPELAAQVLATAPGLAIQLIELEPADYLAHVRSGRSDLALIPAFALQDWAEHAPVFTSEFAVIARKGHPATAALAPGETFPIDLFCALPHVSFSVEGKRATQSDAALRERGLARRVAMTVADFSGVYRTVQHSDMISVLPAELAVAVAGEAGIVPYRPPIPVGPVPILMAWHRRSASSPAHVWLRETVAEILAALPDRFGLKTLSRPSISDGT